MAMDQISYHNQNPKRKKIRIKNFMADARNQNSESSRADQSIDVPDTQPSYDEILKMHHASAEAEMAEVKSNALSELERLKAKTLEDIQSDVQEKLDNGFKHGYEDGFNAGKKEGLATVEELSQSLLHGINQTVEEKNNVISNAGQDILELGFKIAEKIIQTALDRDDSIFKNILVDALHKVTEKNKVIIKVSRADYDSVIAYRSELETIFKDIRQLEIISDSELSSGGCIIDTKLGYIDASISTKKALIDHAFNSIYRNQDADQQHRADVTDTSVSDTDHDLNHDDTPEDESAFPPSDAQYTITDEDDKPEQVFPSLLEQDSEFDDGDDEFDPNQFATD